MAAPNATYDQRAAECSDRGHTTKEWHNHRDGVHKTYCTRCCHTWPLAGDIDHTSAVEGASST